MNVRRVGTWELKIGTEWVGGDWDRRRQGGTGCDFFGVLVIVALACLMR